MFVDILPYITPVKIIIFILVVSRLSGMFITAPLFSTFPIPIPVKAGLIALIAFLTYPIIASVTPENLIPNNMLGLGWMVCREIMIGAMIGFCINIIFIAIQMAGHLLSMQMGLAISNVLDPVTKHQVPIMGQLYLYMAMILFLGINGHHYLFTSVFESYLSLPIGGEFIFSGELIEEVVKFTSQIFVISFNIIMPIFSVLLVADILLGFMSKMMPTMNIFVVSLPIKIYIGFVLMIMFTIKTYTYLSNVINDMLIHVSAIFT